MLRIFIIDDGIEKLWKPVGNAYVEHLSNCRNPSRMCWLLSNIQLREVHSILTLCNLTVANEPRQKTNPCTYLYLPYSPLFTIHAPYGIIIPLRQTKVSTKNSSSKKENQNHYQWRYTLFCILFRVVTLFTFVNYISTACFKINNSYTL